MSFRIPRPPRPRRVAAAVGVLALGLPAAVALSTTSASSAPHAQGPCDLYAAGGTPCVAAHSTTRALSASYDGPLYQVRRASDGATREITPVKAGGRADAAAQDRFCAGTSCVITVIHDQSGQGNDLTQAPPGGFDGPAAGGYDDLADAAAEPVTVQGHKVYGVLVAPGTGYRNNHTHGIAVGDESEGMYAVLDGTRYNGGCCFDYGNAETDSHDDGNGTMEAIYFGNNTIWGSGTGTGPWIMADLENGLFSGVHTKVNNNDPSIRSRFLTAMVEGGPDHWGIRGGDAQTGALDTFYDGARPNEAPGYDPMKKQGAIILGIGGDNSVSGTGTFYEGVMTAGYPTQATEDAVQANIAAQGYEAPAVPLPSGPRVTLRPSSGDGTTAVVHDTQDDGVVTRSVTAASPLADRQAATFVEVPGLADPSCVSFVSLDEPGLYLRHAFYVLHLQRPDGTSLFANDATFCPTAGNAGTGTSFRSVNFPDRYLRTYQGRMYLAANGGPYAQDATAGFAADSTFTVAAPLAKDPR